MCNNSGSRSGFLHVHIIHNLADLIVYINMHVLHVSKYFDLVVLESVLLVSNIRTTMSNFVHRVLECSNVFP